MVLNLLQLGLDAIVFGIFSNSGVEDVELADRVGDHRSLGIIPLQEVHDFAVDDGGLAADDLVAARLDASGLKAGDGVAVLSLATELEDAAVAVHVQAIEDSDVALDLLAAAAFDVGRNWLAGLVELLEMLQIVDEGVGDGYE